tara:strand:- start:1282 stop:1509 length:228 start_codon:yes stop_codon:yes gene_type:complete
MAVDKTSADRGWYDETLVDRLDAEIQTLDLIIEYLSLKAETEGVSAEDIRRVMTAIGNFTRAYDSARRDWLEKVS